MKGTQEEKWLREGQKGKIGVREITSIDEIGLNQSIKLTNNENSGEITISPDQIGVISNNAESESS
jgi:hypothetical protein